MNKILISSIAAITIVASAQAATIPFDLTGTAGAGLLPGNETSSTGTGSGGEIGAGITYDTVAFTLAVNVGWGLANGFGNLTGLVTAQHIHGPTASNNGAGFTQTAGVLFGLTTATNTVTGGTISQTIGPLTAAQQTDLFNGKYYVNLHTGANGGGEMRGFLVQAPEPASAALLGLGAVGLLARRRRTARA